MLNVLLNVIYINPLGKNDGSVSGVRYFQCEPNKGVFSRLTRLVPIPESEDHPDPRWGGKLFTYLYWENNRFN